MQRFVAVSAIRPSALRGRTPGVMRAAHDFTSVVDLQRFSAPSATVFRRRLDGATELLRRSLPRGGQSWGVARKALNLFLRGALYNYYLRRTYRLARSEAWFEVPLDRKVARALTIRLPSVPLPTWRSIRALSVSDSDAYQGALSELATHSGTARVHLDTVLWAASMTLAREAVR